MAQEHATQDQNARKEIQNLYNTVNTLSELLLQQQREIDHLERRIENREDVSIISNGRIADLEEKVEEVAESIQTDRGEDSRYVNKHNQISDLTQIYNQKGFLETETFNSEEDIQKAIKTVAKENFNFIVETEEERKYVCPECLDIFDNLNGVRSHIGAKPDHKNISDYYKNGDKYHHPLEDKDFQTTTKFSNAWSNYDWNATSYLLKNYRNYATVIGNGQPSNVLAEAPEKTEEVYINENKGIYRNPKTGEDYDSLRGFLNSWNTDDEVPHIREYFKNSNGIYENPINGETEKVGKSFATTFDGLDTSLTRYFLQHYPDLPNPNPEEAAPKLS